MVLPEFSLSSWQHRQVWSRRGTARSCSPDRRHAGTDMTMASRRTSKPSTRRQSLYESLDWVLVRVPLLPVAAYLALDNPSAPEEAKGRQNAEPAPVDRLPADPRIRAALAVGSGHLFE